MSRQDGNCSGERDGVGEEGIGEEEGEEGGVEEGDEEGEGGGVTVGVGVFLGRMRCGRCTCSCTWLVK